VNVLTRSAAARALARDLGASWVGDSTDKPPEPLDAAILFAPAGSLVPVALEALGRGGTLSIAGIYLSEIPPLDYDRQLFQERDVRSVTANTRQDGNEFMSLAAIHRLRVEVSPYPFGRADVALSDLRAGRMRGVGVLTMP
jgi:alcohol dehydrogenase, propanol-preferring